MENDYRITKLHGTLIGDNRIPDLPDGEKTKVFSSTNGKTAWVDLPTDVGKDANGFAVLRHDGVEIAGQRKTVKLADVRENGAVIGRDQTTSAPQTDELITKAYADKSYGGLASSNTWTSDNHFNGLTTLENVVVDGGISSDGGGDFIALCNDFSNELGQSFKRVTGFVSPYQLTDITAYEAFGFVNENGLTDISKASVLTYVSTTGKPRWIDLSTGVPTAYDYQLPKKSGTIALTSDLSKAGTSPCLNLIDMDTGDVRTTLTEEEKTGFENLMYSSVSFIDPALGENAVYSTYFPELIDGLSGMFSIYKITASDAGLVATSIIFYSISFGEKNQDGNYPITITKMNELPVAIDGIGGGSSVDNYLVKDIVDDTVTLTNDEFKKLAESNCTLVLRRTRLNDTSYYISSLKVVSSDSGAVSKIKVNAFTFVSSGSISASESYILTFTPDSLTSSIEKTTLSTSRAKLFNKFNILTDDFTLTEILPCSSTDNGKSLSVVNGSAQWTDLGTTYSKARYEHTITIKNSAGKILWTQTMRNSSNTVVNSYANLKTLFGEATYAGFGEYCQLNLEGGTEATDKLIKADGTEVTLASLGAIVYTDKCFLPK